MKKYITRAKLEIDGQVVGHLKNVKEGERELRKQFRLMEGVGVTATVPLHGFTADYVIPAADPEFDFDRVEGVRATLYYENGTKISYLDCDCLKVGEVAFDGENEAVKTVTFGAADRIRE